MRLAPVLSSYRTRTVAAAAQREAHLEIARLQAETRRAVNAPGSRERFLASGIIPVGSTPEALAARVAKDFAKWGAVLRGMRDADGQR